MEDVLHPAPALDVGRGHDKGVGDVGRGKLVGGVGQRGGWAAEVGVGGCFYGRGQDGDAAAEFELVGVVGDKQPEVNGLLYVGRGFGHDQDLVGGWHLAEAAARHGCWYRLFGKGVVEVAGDPAAGKGQHGGAALDEPIDLVAVGGGEGLGWHDLLLIGVDPLLKDGLGLGVVDAGAAGVGNEEGPKPV